MAGGPAPYRRRNRAVAADIAELVFDLRAQGLSLRAIDRLSQDPDGPTGGQRINYNKIHDLVEQEAARRVDPKIDAWRALVATRLENALERLDHLAARATKVLERHHVTVNNGRVITLDGEPLPDDGPVLQAIDRLLKIEAEREKNAAALRRLFGLDMPVKVEATVTETTQEDIELAELVREAQAKNAAEEARIKGEAAE